MITIPISVALVIVIFGAIVWTFDKAGRAQKRLRERQTRQTLNEDLNRSAPTTSSNLPYGLGDDDNSTPPAASPGSSTSGST